MSISVRPPLSSVLAADAMHAPIVSCDPGTPVADVASIMAAHRVHALLVDPARAGRAGSRCGLVSDLDLMRAAVLGDDDATAGEIAASEPLAVRADQDLADVALLFVRHDASHAVVWDRGRAVGVLSTLDLAAVLAR